MGRSKRPYPIGTFRLIPQRSKSNDLHAIVMEWTLNSRAYRVGTGLSINPEDWNPRDNNNIGGLRPSWGQDYKRQTTLILKKLSDYNTKIQEYCINHPNSLTPKILLAIIHDEPITRKDKGLDFCEYARERLRAKYDRKEIKISRYENHKSSIKQFSEFLISTKNGTYKEDSIYIGDISVNLIESFIKWKKDVKKNTDETINHNLTPIIQTCEEAQYEGYIESDLYHRISMLRIKVQPSLEDDYEAFDGKVLSKEELKCLSEYCKICDEPRRKEYIEMYLFAFHACGLRLIDITTLKWSNINFEKKELKKILIKTNKRATIPLSDPAINILMKWKDKYTTPRKYVFDLVDENLNLNDDSAVYRARNNADKCVNQSLKVVGNILKFPITLTFHTARHSFAIAALNDGISMTVLGQMLGHDSTLTTEKVYAQYTNSSLEAELKKLNYDFYID